jgi:hypothetical protein
LGERVSVTPEFGVSVVVPEFDEATHTYRVGGRVVSSVTQILKAVYPDVYAGIPERILERKAMLGIAVHKVIELYLEKRLDFTSLHTEVQPYFESWLSWWCDREHGVYRSERRFYYPAMDYTGTIDFEGQLDGEEWNVDWKITTHELGTHRLQLAGYSHPRYLNDKHRRAALYLRDDGRTATMKEYEGVKDFNDWLATVRVFNIGKTL